MSASRTRKSSKRPKSRSPRQSLTPQQNPGMSSLPKKLPRLKPHQRPKPKSKASRTPGKRLLSFDRGLGARFVAGADEAGRGSLAGPLVVAGVLLDYAQLRDHRVRPLALLNDSKQLDAARREELFCAILGCAERIAVRVISHQRIDREGLHRSNLRGLAAGCGRWARPGAAAARAAPRGGARGGGAGGGRGGAGAGRGAWPPPSRRGGRAAGFRPASLRSPRSPAPKRARRRSPSSPFS